MATFSAGIVLYRHRHGSRTAGPELLLVHPGGPFWANKDTHSWSIPKGEYSPDNEASLVAAEREFHEELGSALPPGERIELAPVKTSSKVIHAWLVEGDFDTDSLVSNSFEMEWPPKSGQQQEFPEVDRCDWFSLKTARTKLHKGQLSLLDEVVQRIGKG